MIDGVKGCYPSTLLRVLITIDGSHDLTSHAFVRCHAINRCWAPKGHPSAVSSTPSRRSALYDRAVELWSDKWPNDQWPNGRWSMANGVTQRFPNSKVRAHSRLTALGLQRENRPKTNAKYASATRNQSMLLGYRARRKVGRCVSEL